jgi:H+/gluconate symporter-like permease
MPDFLSSAIFAPYPLENELAHRLNAMPKIELHVHLEGAVEAATSLNPPGRCWISS